MTEREYEVIALQLARVMYSTEDNFDSRLREAVDTIASIFEHNSKKFNKARFYVHVYGDSKIAQLKVKEREQQIETTIASLRELL